MNSFDPYQAWLDIPPHERPISYYRLLGLRPLESNAEAIRTSAARVVAHVSRFLQSENASAAQQLLAELRAAEGVLLDPARKAAYDSGFSAPQSTPRNLMAPPPVPGGAGAPVLGNLGARPNLPEPKTKTGERQIGSAPPVPGRPNPVNLPGQIASTPSKTGEKQLPSPQLPAGIGPSISRPNSPAISKPSSPSPIAGPPSPGTMAAPNLPQAGSGSPSMPAPRHGMQRPAGRIETPLPSVGAPNLPTQNSPTPSGPTNYGAAQMPTAAPQPSPTPQPAPRPQVSPWENAPGYAAGQRSDYRPPQTTQPNYSPEQPLAPQYAPQSQMPYGQPGPLAMPGYAAPMYPAQAPMQPAPQYPQAPMQPGHMPYGQAMPGAGAWGVPPPAGYPAQTPMASPQAEQGTEPNRTNHARMVRRQQDNSLAYLLVAFSVAIIILFFGVVVLLAMIYRN